jgi:hypothetical protein
MKASLVSLSVLVLLSGCDQHAELTPYTPTPGDTEDLTVSEALHLAGDDEAATIVVPADATLPEVLAAKEVRRYVYLRTGELLGLTSTDELPEGDVVLVAADADPLVVALDEAIGWDNAPGGYLIKSVEQQDRTILVVTGADPDATLHGAYRFAEHLGVGFGLEGDVIPDAPVTLELTGHDEVAEPLLETRGLLPFHDFPAGPDFWNTDDYLLVVGQMPKLGLNFIGLHTYPRWGSTEEAGL